MNTLTLRDSQPGCCLQVIGPDIEFLLSRAQAIQQEQSSPIITVDHLNSALESLQGGAGAGGTGAGGDSLTKADLESTMKQMLMVSHLFAWFSYCTRYKVACTCCMCKLMAQRAATTPNGTW